MSVTYQKEFLRNIFQELKPIFETAHKEVEWEHDRLPLDPDYASYIKMEQKGALHIVTVRKDNSIIGYYISIVHNNHHSKQRLFSNCDLLYIIPEHRKSVYAYKMFKYAEACLKQIGVQVIMFNMKHTHPFHSLAEKLGYTSIETVYGKIIEDNT